jgi:hypothetical protein
MVGYDIALPENLLKLVRATRKRHRRWDSDGYPAVRDRRYRLN